MGWVGLGWVGVQHVVGWVGFVLWWVGLGFKKLTHVHVCRNAPPCPIIIALFRSRCVEVAEDP